MITLHAILTPTDTAHFDVVANLESRDIFWWRTNYLWVRNGPVIWTSPSDDEQVFPSYLMATACAVAAAIAALCCSIVPPLSKIRILFRAAIGQPDALKLTKLFVYCTNHRMDLVTFGSVIFMNLIVLSRNSFMHSLNSVLIEIFFAHFQMQRTFCGWEISPSNGQIRRNLLKWVRNIS